jgi:hypothetical protein
METVRIQTARLRLRTFRDEDGGTCAQRDVV